MRGFEERLIAQTSFDPSRRLAMAKGVDDTNSLYVQHKVNLLLRKSQIPNPKTQIPITNHKSQIANADTA